MQKAAQIDQLDYIRISISLDELIEKIFGLVDKFNFQNNAEKVHHVQIQFQLVHA